MPFVILIAPNVSKRMGGEAVKAWQIYEELSGRGITVHQITHSRVREELNRQLPEMPVSYVEDDWIHRALWRSIIFRMLITPLFMWKAAQVAKKLAQANRNAVIHYTSPISPVIPLFRVAGVPVVVGPINGNIHHPPAFRNRESLVERAKRSLLVPAQLFHRLFFSGKQTADVLLVAGGARTYQSLRMAGCREEQFRDSLDSGIPNQLRDQPRIVHQGRNLRFVHNGRLVPYKGTDLIIKALAKTRIAVELDVIGHGPEKPRLERLAARLGVQDRVHFIDWFQNQSLMYEVLRQYRALVFPSLAEANGIVVQEAMMIGLPVICVDWGGPSLLITPECGILIQPSSEEHVTTELSQAMDRLADDAGLANTMAQAGRMRALEKGFSWSDVIDRWISIYRELSVVS